VFDSVRGYAGSHATILLNSDWKTFLVRLLRFPDCRHQGFGGSMTERLKWLQCPACKETIFWEIPTKALKGVKRFPVAVIVKHEDHYLICYVDSHYQLADTEVAIGYTEEKEEK
jgi:hypothetical protein